MLLTPAQMFVTIFAIAAGTAITRFLPFIAFPEETPPIIKRLQNLLPCAVIGMLMVYCLKDVDIFSGSRGIPEFVAILCIAGLHLWKKNSLLSIAGGTAVYMLLVQTVFSGSF